MSFEKARTLAYFDTLSNWGRWGADDRLGTLNTITDEHRRRAAGLVRVGEVVSLSRDMGPADPDPLGRGAVLERRMDLDEVDRLLGPGLPWGAVREYVGIVAHGSHTHLDGLGHYSWKGKNYNGFDASRNTDEGGTELLSVHQASQGIITRGVLLDIPGLLGVPWLEPGYEISPEELVAAERRQGITVSDGDALLVYTGHFARHASAGIPHEKFVPGEPQELQAGLGAECLPFLRERDVAVLGCDGVQDSHGPTPRPLDLYQPIHQVGLVALGLWLIDNMALDELLDRCRTTQRWDFFFSLLPWRVVGVTSSATNPVAMF